MTTTTITAELGLPALLKRSTVLSWSELPRIAALGLISLVGALPLIASIVFQAPVWMSAIATLPLTLLATGLSRFAVIVWRGGKPRVADGLRFDPVLAVTLWIAFAVLACALSLGGVATIVACVLAAVVLVAAPYALAYGALRDRRGFAAWRGAFILVAYRPSWALTALATTCIAGFVVAASAGALALIVPCMIAVFTCSMVAQLLDTIDGAER